MAVSTYSPVAWNDGQELELDKLKQMGNNEQFLFENMPRMTYRGTINKNGGLRIAAGRAVMSPANDRGSATKQVNFGSFFTPGCQPIVVANGRSEGGVYGSKKLISITGLGRSDPDHRGVTFFYHTMENANAPIQARTVRGGIIYWIAIGW